MNLALVAVLIVSGIFGLCLSNSQRLREKEHYERVEAQYTFPMKYDSLYDIFQDSSRKYLEQNRKISEDFQKERTKQIELEKEAKTQKMIAEKTLSQNTILNKRVDSLEEVIRNYNK